MDELLSEHLSYNHDAILEELIFDPETTHKSPIKKLKEKSSLSKILSSELEVSCSL